MESLGKSKGQNPSFWPRDIRRSSFHHDTPKASPCMFILSSSQTSKEDFLSATGLPRAHNGQCLELKVQTLVELNHNILVRDVERIFSAVKFVCL